MHKMVDQAILVNQYRNLFKVNIVALRFLSEDLDLYAI